MKKEDLQRKILNIVTLSILCNIKEQFFRQQYSLDEQKTAVDYLAKQVDVQTLCDYITDVPSSVKQVFNKLVNNNYVSRVAEQLTQILYNLKCKLQFISVPVSLDKNGKPFVITSRKIKNLSDLSVHFDDCNKTLYFYRIGCVYKNQFSPFDINNVQTKQFSDEDLHKTYYIRYYYEK